MPRTDGYGLGFPGGAHPATPKLLAEASTHTILRRRRNSNIMIPLCDIFTAGKSSQ